VSVCVCVWWVCSRVCRFCVTNFRIVSRIPLQTACVCVCLSVCLVRLCVSVCVCVVGGCYLRVLCFIEMFGVFSCLHQWCVVCGVRVWVFSFGCVETELVCVCVLCVCLMAVSCNSYFVLLFLMFTRCVFLLPEFFVFVFCGLCLVGWLCYWVV